MNRRPDDPASIAPAAYAELAVWTCFSFLRGASTPEELVDQAIAFDHAGMAVTDLNSLAGVVRPFGHLKRRLKAARAQGDAATIRRLEGFRYVVGARLSFCDATPDILVYPEDREAYGRLCRLLTRSATRPDTRKGEHRLRLQDLLQGGAGLLMALAPTAGPEPQTLRPLVDRLVEAAPDRVWLAAGNAYGSADDRRLEALARLAEGCGAKLLAVNDVLYHSAERRDLHDVMTCIREHVTLASAGRRLEPHGERRLKPPEEMARLFRAHPEAVAETQRLMARCRFDLSQLSYEYPQEPTPPDKSPQQHLEDLAWSGARSRYPANIPQKVVDGLNKELAFIKAKAYAPYFLTVHDVVAYARSRKILCQGRGSAANSVVCYCLGVTAVDPNEIELLFERFISEDRSEPPDIDVDFEHERREEVIQHLYARYGRERAAICATVIHYRPRSAIREVGKALGLSEDVTSALAGTVWGSFAAGLPHDHIRQAGLDPANPMIRRAVGLAGQLIGLPRHLSQHVGGFILTQRRLDETVPIGKGAIKDRTFIEWDKDDIDDLGIMKVDVLALGMLSCIRRAFDLLNENKVLERPIEDMAEIRRDDPAVYAMLQKADALGVFQVESRAQMNMLPRLKPEKFYDLVIEVAIVRPGPIQGDMVHPYLRRKQGLEPVSFEAPAREHGPPDELERVLGRTLGVPLFQEQAMQLAITAARFTPSEADGLRRVMATFRNTGRMDVYRDKMVGGMVARGYPAEFAERCWKQIEGFGSYGFPESHAASFAKLVYVSAWLKRHHPAVFACALLNAQPMGFYAPAQIVRDAREHGVCVRAADVDHSLWDCTLERASDGGLALRLGLRQIDGVSKVWVDKLISARNAGPFGDFDALTRRAGLTQAQLQRLAEADAMRSLGLDRRAALWRVRGVAKAPPAPLLAELPDREAPARLPVMGLSEHVVADYQTTRLSLKAHPMSFLRPGFAAQGVVACGEVAGLKDAQPIRAAGVVLIRQRPGTGKVVFITIEDETGVANLVVLPEVFQRDRKVVMTARLIEVQGQIQKTAQAKEVVHILAHRLYDRSDALASLASPQIDQNTLLARADEVGKCGPVELRRPTPRQTGHPREARIIPRSRDFH